MIHGQRFWCGCTFGFLGIIPRDSAHLAWKNGFLTKKVIAKLFAFGFDLMKMRELPKNTFSQGFVWVCDFKMCDLKKVIFKNTVKRLTKLQFDF